MFFSKFSSSVSDVCGLFCIWANFLPLPHNRARKNVVVPAKTFHRHSQLPGQHVEDILLALGPLLLRQRHDDGGGDLTQRPRRRREKGSTKPVDRTRATSAQVQRRHCGKQRRQMEVINLNNQRKASKQKRKSTLATSAQVCCWKEQLAPDGLSRKVNERHFTE